MYILFAISSAVFAGLTTILSKIGIKNMNSNLATGIRTAIILAISWSIVFLSGKAHALSSIPEKTILFLALSGISTGGAWLCYFRALQLGSVGPVSAIDKSSTIVAMILAYVLLKEPFSFRSLLAIGLLLTGTLLIAINPARPTSDQKHHKTWVFYALGAALFSGLTAILGKIGVQSIDSDLATAIRTIFVLICAWGMIFLQKSNTDITSITAKNWLFLILSGITTGASWLCYYRALALGPASVVVPIDKLNIVLTVLFSKFILKENVPPKTYWGLFLLVTGTILLI